MEWHQMVNNKRYRWHWIGPWRMSGLQIDGKDDGEHSRYNYMSNYADRGVSTQRPVNTSAWMQQGVHSGK